MTNEEAIKFLSQIMDAILVSNSWLPSTHNPIKESFGMAINALIAQEQLANDSTELDKENGELIRRKAAIEALKEAFNPSITNFVKAKMAIDNLPSAQPEIIRCKDCDYWNERQSRMYCYEMYFDQDDPDFYCGYAKRKIDG